MSNPSTDELLALDPPARSGLATLPPTCRWTASLPPWAVLTTSRLTLGLDVDPGLWNGWRARRLTPPALPSSWFRTAPGAPLYYQLDAVEVWLARRRGERLHPLTLWRRCIVDVTGIAHPSDDEVRTWVRELAESAGPVQGEIRFTSAGWQSYLATLAA